VGGAWHPTVNSDLIQTKPLLSSRCDLGEKPIPKRMGEGLRAALEATQGQMDGFSGQLPYKYHLEEVVSAGD
jgi:hypothetical protein